MAIEHGKVGYRKTSGQRKSHGLTGWIEQVETQEIFRSRAHPRTSTFVAKFTPVCRDMVAKVGRRNGIVARKADLNEYAMV